MRIEEIKIIEHNHTMQSKKERTFHIGSVSGVRYASRDVQAARVALDIMISQGIPANKTNPSIFHIARYLLTQEKEFEVQGPLTGGECEVVAIRDGDKIFITIGSDHCDRELHLFFADKPKQMCPHPIASVAWPYNEVHEHWDNLSVSSEVVIGKKRITIQDGDISGLVNLDYILSMDEVKTLPDPAFLFCGTIPFLKSARKEVINSGLQLETALGVGDAFSVRLYDPVIDRSIEHQYKAIPLADDLDERSKTFRDAFLKFCEIDGLFV